MFQKRARQFNLHLRTVWNQEKGELANLQNSLKFTVKFPKLATRHFTPCARLLQCCCSDYTYVLDKNPLNIE